MLDAGLYPYGTLPEAMLPDYAIEAGALVRPVLTDAGAPRAAVVLVTLTARAPGGLAASAPLPLVSLAALDADVEVTRTHTPSDASATALGGDGSTWQEYGAGTARYSGGVQALLIEGQRSNALPNARGEGATVGAGAGVPTSWQSLAGPTGAVRAITAYQTYKGVLSSGMQMTGTSTAGAWLFGFQTRASAPAASPSQIWTGSVLVRLAGGSAAGIASINLRGLGLNAAGSVVGSNTYNGSNFSGSITSEWVRVPLTFTLDASGTIARVAMECNWTPVYGVASNVTLAFAWPQLEQAASASSPVLPVVGTPAASTRGTDIPIWTPDEFPRRGCIVIRGIYDAAAGATALGLLQLDNGTDNFRVLARVPAGGLQPEALVVSGGVTTATLTPAGAFVAGSPFVALLAWSPGGVRFGTSVGAVTSTTTAMPLNVSRAVLGHANAAGTLPMVGTMTADFYEFWPSVAEATALLSA